MASKIGDLYWEVDASTTKLNKGLKETDTKAETSGKKMESVGKRMKAAMAVVAAAGVVALGKKIIDSALAAEDAYQIQEAAVIKLDAALRATGQDQDGASASIQAFASELQTLTTVGDEATLALVQVALNSGLTADESQKATKDAIGLSKAFGIDLTAAIKATTNAQQGNYDMLNRYIPAVKNAEGAIEKQEAAELAMANAFEIARAETETSIGVEIQLQNAIGDSQEIVGRYVSEALTPWRKELLSIVSTTNNLINVMDDLGDGALDSNASLESLESALARINELAKAPGPSGRYREEKKILEALIAAYGIEDQFLKDRDSRIENERINTEAIAASEKAEEDRIDALGRSTEALDRYQELRRAGLTEDEKKLEDLQKEINYWNDLIGLVPGAEEVFLKLAEQRNELRKEEIEEEKELYSVTQTITEADAIFRQAQADAQERHLSDLELEKQAIQELADSYTAMGQIGLSVLGDVGYALGAGEDAWDAFAKSGINAIAGVLDALAQQLLAQAAAIAASFFLGNITSPVGVGAALAGAATASLGAGVLRGYAGSFEQGGIVPQPPGVPATGDNMLARVNPGEVITPRDEAGGDNHFTFVIDGDTLADIVVNKRINKGRFSIDTARGLK